MAAERSFDDITAEAWYRLEELQRSTWGNKHVKWHRLSDLTRYEGVICGFSVYLRKPLRKRTFCEIYLAYDMMTQDYSVLVWRRLHTPIAVSENVSLEEAIGKIRDVLATIVRLVENKTLPEEFPKEWTGKSIGDELVDTYCRSRSGVQKVSNLVSLLLILLTSPVVFLLIWTSGAGFDDSLGLTFGIEIWLFISVWIVGRLSGSLFEDRPKASRLDLGTMIILSMFLGMAGMAIIATLLWLLIRMEGTL